MPQHLSSLALTLAGNKGAYSLLIGSGISTSAGIPSGWMLQRRLVEQLYVLSGANPEETPDLDSWFEREFSTAPTYSTVLEAVDASPGGRAGLLYDLFEATPEEVAREQKTPTLAHRSIAELCAKGHFRVIITTNFDRLLEQAMDAISVPYQVISSPDNVDGMRPLMLAPCTIIKVNGDYKDLRIKNTDAELATSDARVGELIERVLSELGLIICGWSGDSDPDLMHRMVSTRRSSYATYSTYRTKQPVALGSVLEARRAQDVQIVDADTFFHQLAVNLTALDRITFSQPLSDSTLVATVKRYVAEDRYRIELQDLVLQEIRELIPTINSEGMPEDMQRTPDQAVRDRLSTYEVAARKLCVVLLAGCYWGREDHRALWSDAISRIASLAPVPGGYMWPDLRIYPTVLAIYTGGIAAVAARSYENLASVLVDAQMPDRTSRRLSVAVALDATPSHAMMPAVWSQIMKSEVYAPASRYLYSVLKPLFAPLYVRDQEFDQWFNRFEVLWSLQVGRQWVLSGTNSHPYMPLGMLSASGHYGKRERHQLTESLTQEAERDQDNWGAIRAGLFGSLQEFHTLLGELERRADQIM